VAGGAEAAAAAFIRRGGGGSDGNGRKTVGLGVDGGRDGGVFDAR